jgi:hypothetical protein
MSMRILKLGSNGAEVKQLQSRLNAVLTPSPRLTENGSFGPETRGAVERFQKTKSLTADGIVGPGTHAALQRAVPRAGATPGSGNGRVNGDLTGVNDGIIAYLHAVANHYGTSIDVTSGKRTASGQAKAMWENWENLENGRKYIYLKNNEPTRAKLDGYRKAGAVTRNSTDAEKAKALKARQDFDATVISVAGGLSLHLTGHAVDVSTKTTGPKVLEALKGGFHYIPETDKKGVLKCHHFDTKLGPAPVVTAEIIAKWPK